MPPIFSYLSDSVQVKIFNQIVSRFNWDVKELFDVSATWAGSDCELVSDNTGLLVTEWCPGCSDLDQRLLADRINLQAFWKQITRTFQKPLELQQNSPRNNYFY
jgi:hypothetical protein